MAKFSKIPESQAPAPTRQSGRLAARMREYEEYVLSLKAGEVGRLVPEATETARGLALRVGRAASRIGRKTRTWLDKNIVYFKVE